MRHFRSLLFLTLLVLISVPIAAQQPPQRDPQALAVLSQARAAFGPSAASLQDSVANGTITYSDGTSGSITIKSKGTALRQELSLPNKQLVYIIKGGQGYTLIGGVRHDMPLHITKYRRPNHIPAISRIVDFLQQNTQVTYVGIENVAGNPAHHIVLTSLPTDSTPTKVEALMSEFHIFVDVQSFRVVKTRSYMFSLDAVENRSSCDTYYSDYRIVQGVVVPFRITERVSGQSYSDISLSNVTLNSGLSDSDFQ